MHVHPNQLLGPLACVGAVASLLGSFLSTSQSRNYRLSVETTLTPLRRNLELGIGLTCSSQYIASTTVEAQPLGGVAMLTQQLISRGLYPRRHPVVWTDAGKDWWWRGATLRVCQNTVETSAAIAVRLVPPPVGVGCL